MKKVLLISIVLFVLGLVLYNKANAAIDQLSSNTTIDAINLSQTFQREGKIGVGLKVMIHNKNNFQIPIQNLKIQIYYQNELIGIAQRKGFILLKNHGFTTLDLPAVIYLKKNLWGLSTELLKNQTPDLRYQVEGKLFGFPIHITDQLLLIPQNTSSHV